MTPEQAIANFTGTPVIKFEKEDLSPLQKKIFLLHRKGVDRFVIGRTLGIRPGLVTEYLQAIREKGHEI